VFISDFAIKRPIVTVTTMIAIVVFGIFALFKTDVDEFPDIQQPIVRVAVPEPGASPGQVGREVVDRMEEQFNSISGIDQITSTSTDGFAQIVDGEHAMASSLTNPFQTDVPAELGWYIEKGLSKSPADRFQSVAEMSEQLERVMAGAFPVQCPVTFVKRVGNEGLRFVDRHKLLALIGTLLTIVVLGAGVVDLVTRIL